MTFVKIFILACFIRPLHSVGASSLQWNAQADQAAATTLQPATDVCQPAAVSDGAIRTNGVTHVSVQSLHVRPPWSYDDEIRGSAPASLLYRRPQFGRQRVLQAAGNYLVSAAISVENSNALTDDTLAVSFTPDVDTVPYQFIGYANEPIPQCQGLGQRCRGNFFIPSQFNGSCPTIRGSDPLNFGVCSGQVINMTTCQTVPELTYIELPLTGTATSCVRLEVRDRPASC